MSNATRFAVIVVTGFVSFACSSGPRFALTPFELRSRVQKLTPTIGTDEIVVPFEVTPELLARAREMINKPWVRTEYDRARWLLRSITDKKGFGLVYERSTTAPAISTVELGKGNCLSLTSLYVGLARGLGLTAYYIDASDRIHDIRREEKLIVDSGHIAAVVRTETGYSMIDFDGDVSDYRTLQIIDDIVALAHYHNNLGYELIHEALEEDRDIDWGEALTNFKRAIEVQPGFSRAENNIGVVYSRQGRIAEAKQRYEAAIAADPDFAAPFHNLGNLLTRSGDLEKTLELYDRAISLQGGNPYLHYHRGLALFRSRKWEEAAKAFERSISLESDYNAPRNVLAQVYRHLGRDEDAARIQESARTRGSSAENSQRLF